MGNVEVLRGMYEAFGRGDIEAVLPSFDPQIDGDRRRATRMSRRASPGRTGCDHGEPIHEARSGVGLVHGLPRKFYDAGEAVIVEGRYSGSYKATGKSIDAQFCHVWKLREGKVTSFQQYLDTARMQDVMGARLRRRRPFRRSVVFAWIELKPSKPPGFRIAMSRGERPASAGTPALGRVHAARGRR